MQKHWRLVAVLLLIFSALRADETADPARFTGIWSGSWEGGGSGGFEMTLKPGSEGKLTGEVAVGTDAGDYTAQFTSLSFDGSKMTAKYDYPPDTQAEIVLTATFEGSAASGEWNMVAKGQGAALAAGTWQVVRK